MLEILRWFSSLNTAAKQLVAGLFMVSWALGSAVIYLYKESRQIEQRITSKFEAQAVAEKKDHKEEVTTLLNKLEKSEQATADCKMQQINFVNSLYIEQKRLNSSAKEVDKQQEILATDNSNYINAIKNGTKKLIEKRSDK